MSELFTVANLVSLLILTVLEIVLGIDNIVFISILSGKLPEDQQGKARKVGLAVALISRIVLLFAISWIMRLTTELFALDLFDKHIPVTGQSLVLAVGGLFLIYKASHEIHLKIHVDEVHEHETKPQPKVVTFGSVIAQIALLDLVFSLDSVITAVGMVQHIEIMVAAVIVAVTIMMVFADAISDFINANPGFKMLALAFLLTIGVVLLGESLHFEVPKQIVYFAMAFSAFVEFLEMRADRAGRARLEQELAVEAAHLGE